MKKKCHCYISKKHVMYRKKYKKKGNGGKKRKKMMKKMRKSQKVKNKAYIVF